MCSFFLFSFVAPWRNKYFHKGPIQHLNAHPPLTTCNGTNNTHWDSPIYEHAYQTIMLSQSWLRYPMYWGLPTHKPFPFNNGYTYDVIGKKLQKKNICSIGKFNTEVLVYFMYTWKSDLQRKGFRYLYK